MTSSLVWISGASRGLGRALADTVPWPDARVIDISRSGAEGLEHVAADLTDPDGWQAVGESFMHELAGFDGERAVFVNNAGTLDPVGFAGEQDPNRYARQVLLNSAAPQILGDAFIRCVTGRGIDSWLITITSGAATSVYEGWSAYGPAKAAVDHWTRTVGAERDRRGSHVRVWAVAPGVVATDMQQTIRDTSEHDFPAVGKFRGLHERGELVDPKDAATRLWALLDRDLDNGAVVDLRDLS